MTRFAREDLCPDSEMQAAADSVAKHQNRNNDNNNILTLAYNIII